MFGKPSAPDPENTVPGRHWEKLDDGKLQCNVCPRHCRLKPGQRGLCYVRAREGDEIVSTTYGRSSGFCVDPIEKKPLFHFLPGSPVLSFGTAGCNLTCSFCQNWDLSRARSMDRMNAYAAPETIARAADELNCGSVAFTYNDPVIFLEYAVDTAKACHERGVRTVAVTAGYIEKEARADFFGPIDAANVDLKGFSEDFYKRFCTAELAPVKETIRWLINETDTWVELTTLLIPGENDSPDELKARCDWVVQEGGEHVPMHFSAFHPAYRETDRASTSAGTLLDAVGIAKAAGLRYVYTGNVRHRETASTWCHNCGALLIGRDVYEVTETGLDATGRCEKCGIPCAGVFDGKPEKGGARRMPVKIQDFQE